MDTVIVVLLLVSCHWTTCTSLQEVCVVPDGVSQDSSCWTSTINDLCQNTSSISHNTVINILNGTHKLSQICEFINISNITFRAPYKSEVVIKCSLPVESGFRFLNVSKLEITGIELRGCGTTESIVAQEKMRGLSNIICAALLFDKGADLNLTGISISNPKSAGIYIYDVAGNVTLDSISVAEAIADDLDVMSGNVVVYDKYLASNATLRLAQSHFSDSGRILAHCKRHLSRGLSFSCGLALFLGNSNLSIVITDTNFSRNSGCNGGNLAVLFFQFASVTISHVRFLSGYSSYGGGVYVSFENSFLDSLYGNVSFGNFNDVLVIKNSEFVDNIAEWRGGGVYIHWKQSLVLSGSSSVVISGTMFAGNCLGKSNKGGGLALHYKTFVDTSSDPNSSPKFHVNLDVCDCIFENHSPSALSEELQSESGVILATSAPYLGLHSLTMEFNNCTAIFVVGSSLVFNGVTKVKHNRASTGAGIRICSSGSMYFNPYTQLIVTNNHAQHTGGGIQVFSSDCLTNIPMCFFQYAREITRNSSLLESVNFIVKDNNASKAGDNIFGGSIDRCYLLWVKSGDQKYRHRLMTPNNTVGQPSSISSNPQQICLDHPTGDNEEPIPCIKSSYKTIYPGEKINVFIRVVGQYNGSVSGAVSVSIEGGLAVKDSEKEQTICSGGKSVTYTVYAAQRRIYSPPLNTSLNLQVGIDSDSAGIHNHSPAKVHITFKECPFGFGLTYSDYGFICQCDLQLLSNCSIVHQTLTKHTHQWVGMFMIKNYTYIARNKNCPLDYCKPNFLDIKSYSDHLDQDEQCQYNRTGILCGSCPNGSSLVLGSSECRDKCSNVWLLLIFPFALAGLLLVAVIHFLNLTVTMGTVCGLIFYANIVQDYFVTLLSSHPIPGLTSILQIFLSWLNLDLGISTCFYDGMGAFGKTMFLFVFPTYIWFISATIIILSNRFIFFTRLVGENAVKVLATLFLLSYSKMLRITMGALNLRVVTVYADSATVRTYRWILDGNIAYFDYRHVIILVIAIIFIIVYIPITMALLCIKHAYSLSNCCRVFSWIDKLKPFFDTYTGPFKDNARFWTGLLLLVRFLLLIVHTSDYNKSQVYTYFINIAACLFLSAIMIFNHGVYKKKCLNVLEYFFILNINVIFLLHTYYRDVQLQWVSILSHLLVSLAFCAFLGIVAYHVYLKFSRLSLFKRLNIWQRKSELHLLSYEGVRSYSSTLSS